VPGTLRCRQPPFRSFSGDHILTEKGYDAKHNVHYCPPGDISCMRAALDSRIGHRIEPAAEANREWARIAEAHRRVYGELLA